MFKNKIKKHKALNIHEESTEGKENEIKCEDEVVEILTKKFKKNPNELTVNHFI
jgi:hypothetical protein